MTTTAYLTPDEAIAAVTERCKEVGVPPLIEMHPHVWMDLRLHRLPDGRYYIDPPTTGVASMPAHLPDGRTIKVPVHVNPTVPGDAVSFPLG